MAINAKDTVVVGTLDKWGGWYSFKINNVNKIIIHKKVLRKSKRKQMESNSLVTQYNY